MTLIAPFLICPGPIVNREVDTGVATSAYAWMVSVVDTDNALSNDNVTCNITSPHEFPVGSTLVACSVIDRSNRSDDCVFTVEVAGTSLQ